MTAEGLATQNQSHTDNLIVESGTKKEKER